MFGAILCDKNISNINRVVSVFIQYFRINAKNK